MTSTHVTVIPPVEARFEVTIGSRTEVLTMTEAKTLIAQLNDGIAAASAGQVTHRAYTMLEEGGR